MLYVASMFELWFFTTAAGRRPVHEFLLAQDTASQDKIYEVMNYFREHGFHLSTQHLRRMSGSKRLWELRTKSRAKQYRLFVAKIDDRIVVLLHAIIKKTQKTPKRDIETAEERLELFLKGGR
jgi:phage-related protein